MGEQGYKNMLEIISMLMKQKAWIIRKKDFALN
jgi:hypothetical protein